MSELTYRAAQKNELGPVVMRGEIPVAICRPIQIFHESTRKPDVLTDDDALSYARLFAAAPDLRNAVRLMMETLMAHGLQETQAYKDGASALDMAKKNPGGEPG